MILMRHGQSEFNVVYGATRCDPGIEDPRLTEQGRRQVETAVPQLAAEGLRRIVASPYTRALETAEIVATALGLPIEVDERVREQAKFACDVGAPRTVLSARWPALRFDALDEVWWPEGEEEAELVAQRCAAFRGHMVSQTDWPSVLVVSHWAFIRALTGHAVTNAATVRYDPATGTARPLAAPADP